MGAGELHADDAEPPVRLAKLLCDGDGVRRSPPLTVEFPGDEQRMSKEAARCGDGDLDCNGKLLEWAASW